MLLSKELTIKNVQLTNRLVLPPMATSKSEDGQVNSNLIHYYKEKSAGGYIGLIITEHAYISVDGIANPGQLSISKDHDIEGLRHLVHTIHENGSKVIAQISHAGSSARAEVIGSTPISASAIVNNGATARNGVLPLEMTQHDIQRIVNCFAQAAYRAKLAGFDGVELHSAHAYLLNQFLSPLTNQRTDLYGTSLMGRIRIHLEIIQAVRQAVGEDFIIALRLGACDYTEGGTTLADSMIAAKCFEAAGIDLLDISGGFCGITNPLDTTPGYFRELASAIKQEVSIPVILTGGITEAQHAEALLQDDSADLIGVGRAFLKDSNWAKKALSPA